MLYCFGCCAGNQVCRQVIKERSNSTCDENVCTRGSLLEKKKFSLPQFVFSYFGDAGFFPVVGKPVALPMPISGEVAARPILRHPECCSFSCPGPTLKHKHTSLKSRQQPRYQYRSEYAFSDCRITSTPRHLPNSCRKITAGPSFSKELSFDEITPHKRPTQSALSQLIWRWQWRAHRVSENHTTCCHDDREAPKPPSEADRNRRAGLTCPTSSQFKLSLALCSFNLYKVI